MKKLLRLLLLLLLLGLGFLYIVKNPELGISQTVLKAIGLERLLISDEPIAMGTGTFTLDEIGTTFTLPLGRTLSGEINTGVDGTNFILSTPEVDNKHYPMYIHGSLQKSTDTLEEVQQTFQVQLTGNGQTFSIDCDGVAPSKCLGVFINSGIYIVGLNSQSDQPDEDTNAPTSVYFPRFAQIQDAINAILYSAVIVPPVMTGSELSGEIFTYKGLSFTIPTGRTAKASTTSPCVDGSCDLDVLRITTDAKDNSGYTVYALLKIDTLEKNTASQSDSILVDEPEKKVIQLEGVSGYGSFVIGLNGEYFSIEIFDYTSEQPKPEGRDDIWAPYAAGDPMVMQNIIHVITSVTK